MTREIKFRCYDKKGDRFLYFTLEGLSYSSDMGVISNHGNWDDSVSADGVEWSQYTGLKDKNGKEIYEGDIVKYDGGNHFVVGFKFGKWLSVNVKDDLKTGILHDLINDLVEMEVIGNIYENSDLLKGDEK